MPPDTWKAFWGAHKAIPWALATCFCYGIMLGMFIGVAMSNIK